MVTTSAFFALVLIAAPQVSALEFTFFSDGSLKIVSPQVLGDSTEDKSAELQKETEKKMMEKTREEEKNMREDQKKTQEKQTESNSSNTGNSRSVQSQQVLPSQQRKEVRITPQTRKVQVEVRERMQTEDKKPEKTPQPTTQSRLNNKSGDNKETSTPAAGGLPIRLPSSLNKGAFKVEEGATDQVKVLLPASPIRREETETSSEGKNPANEDRMMKPVNMFKETENETEKMGDGTTDEAMTTPRILPFIPNEEAAEKVKRAYEERQQRTSEVVEINAESNENGEEAKVELKSRESKAILKNPLATITIDDNNEVKVVKPNGEEHVLNFLPDQAVERIKEVADRIEESDIAIETRDNGDVVYSTNATEQRRLFGLFNRPIETKVELNDSTGEVRKTDIPATSFLGRLLDRFAR